MRPLPSVQIAALTAKKITEAFWSVSVCSLIATCNNDNSHVRVVDGIG